MNKTSWAFTLSHTHTHIHTIQRVYILVSIQQCDPLANGQRDLIRNPSLWMTSSKPTGNTKHAQTSLICAENAISRRKGSHSEQE